MSTSSCIASGYNHVSGRGGSRRRSGSSGKPKTQKDQGSKGAHYPQPLPLGLAEYVSAQQVVQRQEEDDTEKAAREQSSQRMRVNVSGLVFECRSLVFDLHPDTLLGSADRRRLYFDPGRQEYFFDRHRPSFEVIFNYYHQGGKINRPPHIHDDIFLRELEFYEIEDRVIHLYKHDEGYVCDTPILPEHPLKRKVWMLFELSDTSNLAFAIAILSVLFTLLSIIIFCLETIPAYAAMQCEKDGHTVFLEPFFILDTICTAWFTMEVLVRLWACPDKRCFFKDFKNLIDLCAVLPYYLTVATLLVSTHRCDGSAKNRDSVAFLRVLRLVRLFKLTKHSAGLQVLMLTFRASVKGLGLFLAALSVCMLLFSSAIFYAESGRPDSHIESIPDAFWWAIITMCTVGYGDKVPQGTLGKLVGSVCAVAGVLTLAIPVPIITENFNKFYMHRTARNR